MQHGCNYNIYYGGIGMRNNFQISESFTEVGRNVGICRKYLRDLFKGI